MMLHDFEELFSHYGEIIAEMDEIFSSQQFVHRLTHRHQRAYIEALHAYRNSLAPFELVHQRLEEMLAKIRHCERDGEEANGTDLWGNPRHCQRWRKVSAAVSQA